MQTEALQIREALKLSMQVIGVAKLGLIPSERLAIEAYRALEQINDEASVMSFPLAQQRLKEICGKLMPSQSLCRQASDELTKEFRRLNAEARQRVQVRFYQAGSTNPPCPYL